MIEKEKRSGTRHVGPAEFGASVNALGGRLTGAVPLKPGEIVIRFTDTGEECRVTGSGRTFQVAQPAAGAIAGTPLVEISGMSTVLKAILDGKKEASRAFAAGGILVRGDLNYLEAVLKDMKLLECGG